MSIISNFIDSKLTVGTLVRQLPYVLVFKTTHFCWYNCPHCCESAGACQPKQYIPANIIQDYLRQAKSDVKFSNNVVLTGGEIMSSYLFGEKDYVPNILNFCLDNNISTDIKTNAAWVRAKFGKPIFSDISNLIATHAPYGMQISLSLDNYHPNSLDNCMRVIETLARKKNQNVIIHISSFQEDKNMINNLMAKLRNTRGLKLEPVSFNGEVTMAVNRQIILKYSVGTLFNGGRAAALPNAKKTEFPQFKFMLPPGAILIAFDTFGNVTLGENSGRKITTPWRRKDGTPKRLSEIRHDLVQRARYEEMRAIIKEGWMPQKLHTK